MQMKFNLHNSEVFILINMICDRAFFSRIHSYIEPNYFTDPKHGRLFKYIKSYFSKYKKIPSKLSLETIAKRDKKANKILDSLLSEINILYNKDIHLQLDKKYIEDEVIQFIQKAKVWEAYEEASDDFNEGNYDLGIKKLRDASNVNVDKHLGFRFSEPIERYESMKRLDKMQAISTGYYTLDKFLDGGLYPKELTVFSGIFGGFKSLMLANIVANIFMGGKKVLLYSLEMSEERYFLRIDTLLLQKSKIELLENVDVTANNIRNICKEFGGDILIKEYPSSVKTAYDFINHMEELEEVYGFIPDVVAVDYLGLMKSINVGTSNGTYQSGKAIAEELRNLAKEKGIPVITAHQLNREAIDKNEGGTKEFVSGGNISDSVGILYTADNHLVIKSTAQERANSQLSLYVDKARNARGQQVIPYNIIWEHMRVMESDLESIEEFESE